MLPVLHIDVVSDPVCPWCFVGKRRLERALAENPGLEARIRWLPFQLNPDMPPEGRLRSEHYATLFGAERAEQIRATMRDTGREEGIEFGDDPAAKSPNTLAAHALVYSAARTPAVDAANVVERLFVAHHVECEDIGDISVLARFGAEAGMDAGQVEHDLRAGTHTKAVQALIATARQRGVTGVPFFVVNDRYGVSGAQPPEVLADLFGQVLAAVEKSAG